MKQLLILAISLLSLSATVQAAPAKTIIPLTEKFHSIVINDDIAVVLTESNDTEITISGEDKYVSRVDYTVSNGKLTISSKKGFLKNRVVVYVPVKNLRSIEVNGESKVSNKGWLLSPELKVIVNGLAKIELYNKGEVVFESDAAIDIEFQKWVNKKQVN